MSTAELNDDHGLTDEEQAALKFDDSAEGAQIVDPDADPEATAQPAPAETPAAADPAADADADPVAANADAPAAANAEPEAAPAAVVEQPKPEAAPAPILIAQAPEDAAAKLEQIAADKSTLIDKWEAGEVTGKEYQQQLDALNEQQADIKAQVREAELAKKLNDQQIQNQWIADSNRFIAEHPEYADPNGERRKLIDETIMALARMPSNAGLSNEKALAKAHRMVIMELGEVTPAAATPAAPQKVTQHKVPKPEIPPNVGTLPAAAMNDTTGGEFASLDALAKTDLAAYEAAVEKLTPAQQARYFRA